MQLMKQAVRLQMIASADERMKGEGIRVVPAALTCLVRDTLLAGNCADKSADGFSW